MPKIHISKKVNNQLDLLMQHEIQSKLKGKKGRDLTLAVMEIAKSKFGVTYSSMIEKLINNYR